MTIVRFESRLPMKEHPGPVVTEVVMAADVVADVAAMVADAAVAVTAAAGVAVMAADVAVAVTAVAETTIEEIGYSLVHYEKLIGS